MNQERRAELEENLTRARASKAAYDAATQLLTPYFQRFPGVSVANILEIMPTAEREETQRWMRLMDQLG